MFVGVRTRQSTIFVILLSLACGLLFIALIKSWFPTQPRNESGRGFVKNRKIIVQQKEFPVAEKKPEKIILFWTTFFGGSNSYMGQEGDRLRYKKCPVSNCILTEDRTLWRKSSALIFHGVETSLEDLPPHRLPHQYYIFFLLESPVHSSAILTPGFFNLTFTYRFDSDIIADNYLQFYKPKLLTSEDELNAIWTKKTKGAAAMVSNCEDFRMRYIEELAKTFPVDIYGSCGDRVCPKTEKEKCDEMLSGYKFYLSFENSICEDYLTEKAIRGYMSDVIPVFMGAANYSAIFPSGSFLSTNDFRTPKDLATEMHRIANNKFEYLKYFQFRYDKRKVKLPDYLQPDNCSLCKLCELLNADTPIRKTYPDMTKWWSISTQCTLKSPNLVK